MTIYYKPLKPTAALLEEPTDRIAGLANAGICPQYRLYINRNIMNATKIDSSYCS
jgi:hypothetical protein